MPIVQILFGFNQSVRSRVVSSDALLVFALAFPLCNGVLQAHSLKHGFFPAVDAQPILLVPQLVF